jgi:altronate dehydratase small subunit
MTECFQINPADNVATMLDNADTGPIRIRGPAGQCVITSRERIDLGHKVALCDIPVNSAIVKYGVMIGKSSKMILQGEWVHLHNCSSCIDERSAGLDVHTGLPGDKAYE